MMSLPSAARRALWVLVAVCALVTIFAGVVVSARPGPAPLPAGQPAAAAQAYTQAFVDEDWEAVRRLSTQDGLKPCPYSGASARMRIDVLEVTEHSDAAQIQVRITDAELKGPLSLIENSYVDLYQMQREAGQWKVSQAPWNLSLCTDEEMGF